MAAVVTDKSTIAEQIRYRKSRTTNHPSTTARSATVSPEADPDTTRSKFTISSLLTSSFTTTTANDNLTSTSTAITSSKKKNFTSSTFRGLGCAASSEVSVPAVIRTSANWESDKVKKKKKMKSKKNKLPSVNNNSATLGINNVNASSQSSLPLALSSSCVGVPDVWCGPGIGVTTDATSVDYVVSRRPPVSTRGKVDGVDKNNHNQRERSCTTRRMVNREDLFFLDPETALGVTRSRVDDSASRHHVRHRFPEELAEIVMLQSSLMGERSDGLDQYGDWRLDVDSMSYEELLELGERIGYVSTGLKEEEITRCLRKTKLGVLDNSSSYFLTQLERKCSICQEDYEADDEMGKLNCGHLYHSHCIKEWLVHKNICPICKTTAVVTQT